jgi:hypothetical protein
MEVKVGIVSHVFEKIGVAILDISEPLQTGDTIRITGHHTDFTQKVESMQVEHQNVKKTEGGQCVGLKIIGEVREHDLVYKVVD